MGENIRDRTLKETYKKFIVSLVKYKKNIFLVVVVFIRKSFCSISDTLQSSHMRVLGSLKDMKCSVHPGYC